MASSYPKTQSPAFKPIPIQTLPPIFPPTHPISFPELASPPRKPAFGHEVPYVLSTHIIPAAYRRITPDVPLPPSPPPELTKLQRREFWLKTRDDLLQTRRSASAKRQLGELEGCDKVLWNCLNRYVKKDLMEGGKGVTLFFAHANGFPKEIWECTLQHLLSSSAGQIIDEVWTWESVQHGDSALLNAGRLGGLFDWKDNSRDILNFLLHYIPSDAVTSAPLPTHLPRVSLEETNSREINGFSDRTFVTVGHSFGGCTSVIAALTCPRLFSSLILIDPVIIRPGHYEERGDRHIYVLALGALQRRDTWSSREEALDLFRQSPFFGAWDPVVLQSYIECGLTEDTLTGGVELKMPSMQEAVVFVESETHYEAWQRLEDLDERIELRWIVPGKPGANELGGPGATAERVWRRPNNTSNIRIPTAGHLIPHEAPLELARDIQEFLQRKYVTRRACL